MPRLSVSPSIGYDGSAQYFHAAANDGDGFAAVDGDDDIIEDVAALAGNLAGIGN
jgi:hypothetical protein